MWSELKREYQNLIEFIEDQSKYRNNLSLSLRHEDLEPLSKIIKERIEGCPKKLRRDLFDEFFEYGPLNQLFCDESITEILLNGDEKIHIIKSILRGFFLDED